MYMLMLQTRRERSGWSNHRCSTASGLHYVSGGASYCHDSRYDWGSSTCQGFLGRHLSRALSRSRHGSVATGDSELNRGASKSYGRRRS